MRLCITAERTVDKEAKTHREFSYGSFARTVRLPAGTDAEKVTARYDAGILVNAERCSDPNEIEVTGCAYSTTNQTPTAGVVPSLW